TALTSFHAGGSAGTPQQVATGGDGGATGTTPMCALEARVGPRLIRRQVSAHVPPRTSPTAVAAARPATYYCRRGTGQTRMLRRRSEERRVGKECRSRRGADQEKEKEKRVQTREDTE